MHPIYDIFFGLLSTVFVFMTALLYYFFLTKQKSSYFYISALCCAGSAIVALLFYYSYTTGLSSNASTIYQEQGNAIILEIESFKEKNGRYPSTLSEAGITPPNTRFGPWRYRMYKKGGHFELLLGDYRKNGFILGWISQNSGWGVDT